MKLNRLHEVLTQQMTNHRLSIEQKFQLEAAFRDIDAWRTIDIEPISNLIYNCERLTNSRIQALHDNTTRSGSLHCR